MKKNLMPFLFIILVANLLITGCDGNNQETFELTGSWSMTSPVSQIMTFTQTVCTSDLGFKGLLISYNNEENWYVVQPTEGANGDEGKYSMTKYTLSENGDTFTGTSYSSEDTETAAKASTTETYSGITMTKQ